MLTRIMPPIDHGDQIRMKYNRFIQKVVMRTVEGVRLVFAKRLAELFGFDSSVELTGQFKSERPIDVKPVHHMFVYTDIVEYNTVGGIRAPLLRFVTVEGEYGETITKTFDTPHYVPLKQSSLSTIEIDIRDDTGEHMPFTGGKVITKLHLRRRRLSYFR